MNKKRNYKIISNGFSLVEVMIVVGILGGLSLVVMNLTKQSSKSSVKLQFDSDVTLTTNEINALLSDPVKCLSTLGSNANPNNISGKFYTTSSGSSPGAGYGNSGLLINSYSFTGTAPAGELNIKYTNKNILKGTSGTDTITKKINIFYQGSPGAVTSCRSLSTSTTDVWSKVTPTSPDAFYMGKIGIGTNVANANLDVAGEVKFGNTGVACTAINRGAQRYNASTDLMEYCSNSDWRPFGGGGGTQVNMYRCPGPVNIGGGAWGFYGCQNQITNVATCYEVEYPNYAVFPCTYIGKMTLTP